MLGQASNVLPINPPYIKFETRAIERRKLAHEGGTVFYVDVDYALVTSHGSKDTVEKALPEWFDYLQEQARQQRFPQDWLVAYRGAYAAWKSGQEIPVIGTPVKNWPVATPAEVKMLQDLGIRAVEDLASANETLIHRLGMGGRSLCSRAKDWVLAKDGTAPLVQQMDALRHTVLGMEQQVKDLMATNNLLQARLNAQRGALDDSARSGEPIDPRSLEDRLLQAQAEAESGRKSEDEAIDEVLSE